MSDTQRPSPSDLAELGPDERSIARLLRAAGPRAPVPAEDFAAAERVARAEWRRTVEAGRFRRRGSRSRVIWTLAAALALALGALLWQGVTRELFFGSPAVPAVLELASGRIQVLSEDGATTSPSPGDPLAEGVTIETATPETGTAFAALRLAGGASVRLDAGSRLRLLSASALALDRGRVYVDSEGPGSALEVRTLIGTATDIGTQFEVHLTSGPDGEDLLRLRVREGTVLLSQDGTSHTTHAGSEVELLADGTLVQSSIATHGPLWHWVVAASPGIDTEGRSVLEVLEWAAREGGWELRLADGGLDAEVAEEELLGSVTLRDPAAAVHTVMLSSKARLTHRIEDGVLTVERAD